MCGQANRRTAPITSLDHRHRSQAAELERAAATCSLNLLFSSCCSLLTCILFFYFLLSSSPTRHTLSASIRSWHLPVHARSGPPLCCHDNCRDLHFLLPSCPFFRDEGYHSIQYGLVPLTTAISLCAASISSSSSERCLNGCLRASWHLRARHQSTSRQPPSDN